MPFKSSFSLPHVFSTSYNKYTLPMIGLELESSDVGIKCSFDCSTTTTWSNSQWNLHYLVIVCGRRSKPRNYLSCCSWIFHLMYALLPPTTVLPLIFIISGFSISFYFLLIYSYNLFIIFIISWFLFVDF